MILLTHLSRALQAAGRASAAGLPHTARTAGVQQPQARAILEELEPRVLYSADSPLALLGEAVVRTASGSSPAAAAPADADARAEAAAPATASREIAFVDTQVDDYQGLVADLRRQADAGRPIEVHLLDAGQDGIRQITDVLQGRRDITALHIFSHGIDGAVELGGAWLNAFSLEARADAVAQWGAALSADADILLYGCDVAADADGQAFIGRLAELTGADVAASRDATGSATLGGNWTLEYATGAIEASLAVDARGQAEYGGVLAITVGNVSSTLDTGVSSLTFGHTIGGDANAILLVEVSTVAKTGSATTTTVTYGGVNLTLLGVATNSNGSGMSTEMWYLKGPSAGTASVVISLGGSSGALVGSATSYHGVSQANPFGGFVGASGTSNLPRVTVASAPDELVVDSVVERGTATTTPDAGQTERYRQATGGTAGSDVLAASSIRTGAASTTMGWTTYSGNTSSQEWALAAVALKPANTAPSLTPGAAVILTPTNEDTPSSGTTVNTLLGSAGWADADAGASKGIAVTATTGRGTWQYSTDGVTWKGFGTVSSTSALLLTSTSQVRYLPDTLNGETASFAFKAWDQTTDTASTNATPAYASTAMNGGSWAYSSQDATASLTVADVNDAPSLVDGRTTTFATTNEDTPSSTRTVDSLLTSAGWADVDSGALKGIAVTSVTGNGAWQYSTDNGTTWAVFGSGITANNALLLAASSQVRYQPDLRNGETASFAFKAWDQTSGTASTNAVPAYGSTASSGGTTAYSSQSAGTSLTVTSVNDAPTITNGATVMLTATNEDTPSSGTAVDNILALASWDDVDGGAAKGIAVTSVTGNGAWQYSADNGTTWTGFGTGISATNALLLTSASQVRYQPDLRNGETASFAFKAWDQTGGAASTNVTPAYGSTASSGGTSVYSSQNAAASLTVTPVNDAPTITSGATVVLTPTNEDMPSSGTTVDNVVTAAGWADVDNGAAKGIAVTGTTGNGAWQYSTDNGATWTGFGTGLTANNALLLASTSQVRYQPDSLNGETAGFAFKAWDQTSDTASAAAAPRYASTASSGGTTAYSSQNASASITVSSVNDAPTLANSRLPSVAVGASNPSGQSVGTLFDAQFSDVDTGSSLAGIAVIGNTATAAQGAWQYSSNGGAGWKAIGTVDDANGALVIGRGSLIRFVPAGTYTGNPPDLVLRALDNSYAGGYSASTATEVRVTLSTSAPGGTTAIAAASSRLVTSVESTNTAPVLTGTNDLAAIDEDAYGNGGTLVSTLIAGKVTSSASQVGIAVTGVDNSHGRWQFSRDGGGSWSDFGAPSDSTARLLAGDSLSRVRFVPDADWNGTVSNGLSFRAWDQTSGTAGGTANTAARNSTFLDRFATASYSNNDGNAMWTGAWVENDSSGGGVTDGRISVVPPLLKFKESNGNNDSLTREADLRGATVAGLSVVLTTNSLSNSGAMALQISGDGGATFTTLQTITSATATGTLNYDISAYIGARTQFRIYENAGSNGAGSFIDIGEVRIVLGGSNGGSSAYSAAVARASIDVRAVNDAPTLVNGRTVTLAATNEDTPSSATSVDSILSAAGWADVDAAPLKGIAVTSATGNGAWQYSADNGTTWTAFGRGLTASNALLLASTSQVRYQPDTFSGETATFSFKAWDQTSDTASASAAPRYASTASNGGTTAYSSQNASASIAVASVNDAPTLGNARLPSVAVGASNPPGQSVGTLFDAQFKDVDTGSSLAGVAVIGNTATTAQGTWQYSSNGGAGWKAIGTVDDANGALVIGRGSLIRFVPAGTYTGNPPDLVLRALDNSYTGGYSSSAATEVRVTLSTSAPGGTTAIAAASSRLVTSVESTNTAPVLTGTNDLAAIDEDAYGNNGTLVSTLIAGKVTSSASQVGIAVTDVDNSHGRWQYSRDGGNGGSWADFGTPSDSAARLLAGDSLTRVRFVPDADWNGTVSNGLSFRAWDQTSGTAGGTANTAARNNTFLDRFATASYSNNDGNAMWTSAWVENDPNGGGATGGNIYVAPPLLHFGESSTGSNMYREADLRGASSATLSIGLVRNGTASSGNIAIQVSGNGGTTFTTLQAITSATPTGTLNFDISAYIGAKTQVRIYDNNSGGKFIEIGEVRIVLGGGNGGGTAYSSAVASASTDVRAVNDAPTITNGANVALTGTDEDTTSSATSVDGMLTSAGWNDVDAAPLKGIAVTGTTGNGAWQYSTDGTNWTGFGTVSANNALLLASTSQVRYQPDTLNGETAGFAFKAWDQTSDTASAAAAPRYASTASSGGTTAYSSQNASASITVSSVNDAPTLGNSRLPSVAVGASNPPGQSVGTLFDAQFKDVDTGSSLAGVAVIGNTATTAQGTWQYSSNGGAGWKAIGTVDDANGALVIGRGSLIRFVPAGTYTGNPPDLVLRALDNSYAGGYSSSAATEVRVTLSTSAPGGTTAIAAASSRLVTSVESTNTAPVLTGTNDLAAIDEDAYGNGGTLVSTLISGKVTSGASQLGIAVTGVDNSHGRWQFSRDGGGSWSDFGAPSDSAARLLAADSLSRVRFVPDADWNGTVANGLTFRAWDQTSGTAGGTANTAARNGTFLDRFATASYSNNDGNAMWTSAWVENDSGGGGATGGKISVVAPGLNFAESNGINDSLTREADLRGATSATLSVVLTANSMSPNGSIALQISGDGGATFTTLQTLTVATATGTLNYDISAYIGARTQFRIYENAGANGTTKFMEIGEVRIVLGGSNGGSSAYSSAVARASLDVRAVNDAPTITNGANVALPPTDEDTASSGTSVDSLLTSASWADIDAAPLKGIAVTGTTGNGAWQYSTDNGTTWTGFGTGITASNALLLTSTSQVRYQPDLRNGETASFAFKAWDQTSGTASTNATPAYGSAASSGGITAYSSQNAATSLTVTPINDAPTITSGATIVLTPTDEDTPSVSRTVDSLLLAVNWADVDNGALKGIAVTSVIGNGAWQYSTDGVTWKGFGAVSANNALLLTSTSQVRYQPDLRNGETASFAFKAWDQTSGTRLDRLPSAPMPAPQRAAERPPSRPRTPPPR